MATITKQDMIAKLSALDAPGRAEASIERALATLGWQSKDVFTGAEVVALGTQMAKDAQADLAASADPADRAKAEALDPYMAAMDHQVLPHLDPKR